MTLFKWVLVLLLLSDSLVQVHLIHNPPKEYSPTMRWFNAIANALLAFWALSVLK